MNRHYKNIVKQQGAVLVTALVFMAILTLMGISAMRSNVLDVRIHNSMKNRGNAFQCAESALRQGENYIADISAQPEEAVGAIPDRNAGEVWEINSSLLRRFLARDDSWWDGNTWSDFVLSDPDAQVGCANAANFVVESLGGIGVDSGSLSFADQMTSQMNGYRITSRSEGVSDQATVILQSTFIRQFR